MNEDMKGCIAEAIGTFFLCFIGASSICTVTALGAGAAEGLLMVAVAHGLVLSIAISATMAISGGQLNPAVSITLVATGHQKVPRAVMFIISQLIGATIAGFLCKAVFSGDVKLVNDGLSLAQAYATSSGGTPEPASGLTTGHGILIEAILTFFLVFAIFGTAVDPRAPKIGGFGIGLAIGFDILVGGPLTGASMNPARTFGPGLAAGVWNEHIIYWIGPIVGGLIAGLIYQHCLMDKGDSGAESSEG